MITGDTRPARSVLEAALEADLLVHEATFSTEEAERADETGHSTAADAAELGRVAGAAGRDPAQSFIDWLTSLKARIGIPAQLGAVGIDETQIERLSDTAFHDGCHAANPRPCSRADFEQLFREAL